MCRANATIKFIFKQLSNNDSILASRSITHLLNRIKDYRRNGIKWRFKLLKLENESDYFNDDMKNLLLRPSNMPIKQIISVTKKMKMNEENEQKNDNIELPSTSKTASALKEKLQFKIENSIKTLTVEAIKNRFF